MGPIPDSGNAPSFSPSGCLSSESNESRFESRLVAIYSVTDLFTYRWRCGSCAGDFRAACRQLDCRLLQSRLDRSPTPGTSTASGSFACFVHHVDPITPTPTYVSRTRFAPIRGQSTRYRPAALTARPSVSLLGTRPTHVAAGKECTPPNLGENRGRTATFPFPR